MIRLLATLVLALALVLMPLGMTSGTAMALPQADSMVAACPEHHQPATPDAPASKGAMHCLMCVALPQADEVGVPDLPVPACSHPAAPLPRLAGIGADVSDPPPKVG